MSLFLNTNILLKNEQNHVYKLKNVTIHQCIDTSMYSKNRCDYSMSTIMFKEINEENEAGKKGGGKEVKNRALKVFNVLNILRTLKKAIKKETIRNIYKEVFVVYTIAVVLLLLSEDIKYGFVSFYIKTNYLIALWGVLFIFFLLIRDKKIDTTQQH